LLQPDGGGAGASSKAELIDEYLGIGLHLHSAALEEEEQGSAIAAGLEIVTCLEFHAGDGGYPGCRTLFLHQHLSTKR
jgi:hypothetical protein